MPDPTERDRPVSMFDLVTRHRGVLQGQVDWLLSHGHPKRAAYLVSVGVTLERWQRELRDEHK